jgi:hypothetical protein
MDKNNTSSPKIEFHIRQDSEIVERVNQVAGHLRHLGCYNQ